jgi:hypothetical protein
MKWGEGDQQFKILETLSACKHWTIKWRLYLKKSETNQMKRGRREWRDDRPKWQRNENEMKLYVKTRDNRAGL